MFTFPSQPPINDLIGFNVNGIPQQPQQRQQQPQHQQQQMAPQTPQTPSSIPDIILTGSKNNMKI